MQTGGQADMGKIFAIGDIHGCSDKLTALMDKIEEDFDHRLDTLVFMGDYIDRGPDSFGVISCLIDLKNRFENIIFLKGNHEDMLEKYLLPSNLDKHTYIVNGGKHTLESYMKHCSPGSPAIPPEHLHFFSALSDFYETDDYIFVHAGLREHVPLEAQIPDDFLWIRSDFIHSDYDFGKIIVFGHTPFIEPLIRSGRIGIDTGAVYGNKLTCVKLPDIEFYSV